MPTLFTVPDLDCHAYIDTIDRAIQTIDRQATISADSQTKLVQIESMMPEIALRAKILEAGYTIGK